MTQFATLTPESRIDEAIELLLRTSQSEFPIVDHAQRPVGILSRADFIRALKELGPETRVKDATLSALPDLRPSLPRWKTRSAPAGKGAPAVGVLDGAGPAGWARELRNARRNADDRGRHAAWIPPGQRPPARGSLKGPTLPRFSLEQAFAPLA